MRIGIDARLYGLEHAGLGRYVVNLVDELLKKSHRHQYTLFVTSKHVADFTPSERLKIVTVDIPVYSLREQILLPVIFKREKLDLLHVPHFNAPILYPGKMLITIHDLIKHYSTGKETTTRAPWLYQLKRFGYQTVISAVVNRANHLLTPTDYVKNDVVSKFKLNPDKVTVTYEAVGNHLKPVTLKDKEKKALLQKHHLQQPFIVYTGSVYPHKNVDLLLEAIKTHNQNKEVDLQLALICSRSVFWERLNLKIKTQNLSNSVKLLGFVDDADISRLYSLALALVHPSKMEGFGLTGLEAMKLGLPVLSSNATCLPEVYGDAALYFDPNNLSELVFLLENLIKDKDLRDSLIQKGYKQAQKYSWSKMAKETLAIYQKLLS